MRPRRCLALRARPRREVALLLLAQVRRLRLSQLANSSHPSRLARRPLRLRQSLTPLAQHPRVA